MRLSTWEQQALDSIKGEISDSDPALVTLLTTFTRLASGEAMPVRDKPGILTRRITPHPLRKQQCRYRTGARQHPIRRRRRFGVHGALILAWFVTTAGLIAVALVLNLGSSQGAARQTCTGAWPVACSDAAPG